MDGSFTIPSLDPALLFKLLAVSPEHEPTFVGGVDPLAGDARVVMKPRPPSSPEHAVLRGRAVDDLGEPVLGATVSCYAMQRGDTTHYGSIEGLDPVAISDQHGEFALYGAEDGALYHVEVRARARAVGFVMGLGVGEEQEIELGPGAEIHGRLLQDGEPVPGVAMGLVQEERSDGFAGELVIATDGGGHFTFRNAMPSQRHFVYGKMNGLAPRGAVTVQALSTPGHGESLDIGDLELRHGLELSGILVRTDGDAIPGGTRLSLSRQKAWDSQIVEVDREGRFHFRGLPPERYRLVVRVPGLRLSPTNWSLDILNFGALEGWIRESKLDLEVLLEPGTADRSRRPDQAELREYVLRTQSPMRGAEGG